MMTEETYEERVFSRWTEALFIGLAVLFLALFILRVSSNSFGILSGIFLFFWTFDNVN